MNTREMRRQVLDMARKAYREGLFAGTSGNLSLRDPQSGLFAITPGSLPYDEMMPSDIVVMDPDGRIIEEKREPSSEWRMHAGIYRARNDIHAVVHTHSPEATAFAVVQKPIPVVLIEMLVFLHGDVRVAKYHMPGSPELAESALEALQNRAACLMANHGVVAVGETLEQAYLRAVYTEDSAKICSRAMQLGEVAVIPQEEQAAFRHKLGLTEDNELLYE